MLQLDDFCSLEVLSHNKPCFPCNIAITNYFVSHTCDIRFNDVIDRTVRMLTSIRHPTQNSNTWQNEYVLDSYFFYFDLLGSVM